MKTIDINKATNAELRKYIRNNANYINGTLSDLEKAGKEYAPAYRYIIDKYQPRHKDLFVVKNGNIRFKSRKTDIEKLSQEQLRQLATTMQTYKSAKTSSLYKVNRMEERIYTNLSNKLGSDISKEDFKKIVTTLDLKSYNTAGLTSDKVLKFIKNVGIETALETLTKNSDIKSLVSLYKQSEKFGAQFTSDELSEYLKE